MRPVWGSDWKTLSEWALHSPHGHLHKGSFTFAAANEGEISVFRGASHQDVQERRLAGAKFLKRSCIVLSNGVCNANTPCGKANVL